VDQVEMPDLEFLRDLAKDWSIKLKIFNRQLIMYSEEEYEAKPPVYTLLYGASNIISYQFTSVLNDMYAEGKVAYMSPETGENYEGTFEAEEPPEGTEAVNEDTTRIEGNEGAGGNGATLRTPKEIASGVDYSSENAAAAEAAKQKAKSKLREKNKWEKECTIVVVGDPGYLSGLCVQLLGFGIFDGQWFIDTSRHSISEEGYVTELQMHMALKGY
jgi:phage protein D